MHILKSLFQPPGLQLVMLAVALLCWFRFRHISLALVLLAFASLYLLSTAAVSNALLKGLEGGAVYHSQAYSDQSHSPEAIVILGTGVLGNTPEYDMEPQPGSLLIQRLRYGLKLQKETGLPILVSGGSRYGINEALVMKKFLNDHNTQVQWTESSSRTTRDNARNSAAILGRKSVLLVTHAWHMPRAAGEFEMAGFTVTAASTAKLGTRLSLSRLDAWLPDVRYLRKSQLALHEYAGMVWYRFLR